MIKRLVALVALCAMSGASLAAYAEEEKKYFEIGRNPVDPYRAVNPETERLVCLDYEVRLTIGQKDGPPTTAWTRPGEAFVVNAETGVATRVFRCGNPIYWPENWKPEPDVRLAESGKKESGESSASSCCKKVTEASRPAERPQYLPKEGGEKCKKHFACSCGKKKYTVLKVGGIVVGTAVVTAAVTALVLSSQDQDSSGGGLGGGPAPEPPN